MGIARDSLLCLRCFCKYLANLREKLSSFQINKNYFFSQISKNYFFFQIYEELVFLASLQGNYEQFLFVNNNLRENSILRLFFANLDYKGIAEIYSLANHDVSCSGICSCGLLKYFSTVYFVHLIV